MKAEYIRKYQELWYDVSFGGEEGKGRWSSIDDLEFIASYEKLADEYLERLADLGKNPWITQTHGLKDMFERAGNNYSKF